MYIFGLLGVFFASLALGITIGSGVIEYTKYNYADLNKYTYILMTFGCICIFLLIFSWLI